MRDFFMRTFLTLTVFLLIACNKDSKQVYSIELSSIEQESPVEVSLRGISVVDSNVVWLSGAKGTILRTLNGGTKWELIRLSDQDSLDFRSIHAFSAQEVIVASAGFPARVYRTEDGGANWQLVYENPDSSAFMNSIAFKSKKQGIIFGDVLDGCHLILQTLDCGKSWKRIKCAKMPQPLAYENGFAASNSCIAVTKQKRYVIGLGGQKSRVFTSPKGNVWQAVNTSLGGGLSSRGIYSLAAGAQRLIAVGGDYTKADSSYHSSISNDQGKSWQKGGILNGYRSVVDYSARDNIWLAAGTNGIDYSLDQGNSWLKAIEQEINTLQFDQRSGLAWAASSKGNIYRIEIIAN